MLVFLHGAAEDTRELYLRGISPFKYNHVVIAMMRFTNSSIEHIQGYGFQNRPVRLYIAEACRAIFMPVRTKNPRVNPKAMEGTSIVESRVAMSKDCVKETLSMKCRKY